MKNVDVLVEFLKEPFNTYPFFQYENWREPIRGRAFESYFADRPSGLRKDIVRREKKLQNTHGLEIAVVTGGPAVGKMLQDFITVYNRSWKTPEPFPDFLPSLVSECAKLDVLRLGVLYTEDKPAAAQLWITGNGRAFIYKIAYDEQYSRLGVGAILSKEMFRIAIDVDRVAEIDYGLGSEPYKKAWMSDVTKIQGVELLNRNSAVGSILSIVNGLKSVCRQRFLVPYGHRPSQHG